MTRQKSFVNFTQTLLTRHTSKSIEFSSKEKNVMASG
jgi:hypothetical protein